MNLTEQKNYPDEWIQSYLNGELAPEQKQQLEDWVAADSSHKKYFYEMTEVWLTTTALSGKAGNKEQAYKRFEERLSGAQSGLHSFRLPRWLRVAAAACAGVVVLGGTFWLGNENGGRNAELLSQTIEVPMGSRSRIVLQDSTVVWLNAGSKLTYSSGFAQKERNVILEGEGYFEVTHNPELPFVVNTSYINVQVYGTKFSVKAYGNEDEIQVTLAEGSVKFVNKNDLEASFMMKPEQQAVFSKQTGEVDVRKVLPSVAGEWITGAHFFNEMTFSEIAGTLEKAFGVTIIFRNEEKRNLIFYGDFSSEDTLDDILTIMASSGKFNYSQTRNRIEVF